MSGFMRVLVAAMAAIILIAVLSLTILNRHSANMRSSSLMREGRVSVENGDIDQAIEAFRLALSINDTNINAYIALANAHIYNEEFEEALLSLRIGMQRTNRNARIRNAYNDLLRAISQHEDFFDDQPFDDDDYYDDFF